MKRGLGVLLGDGTIALGTLRYEQQRGREHASFEYTAEWLGSPDRFAIDPSLPLVAGPQYHRAAAGGGSIFHGAIADTEPDGWAKRVIARDHLKARQRARRSATTVNDTPVNAVDYLLAVDDLSRVGALRFRDEAGALQRVSEPGRRTAPPLIELAHLLAASRAVETDSETAADLAYLRGRGTSVGGMRPKCTVVDADGHLAIGKFPSVGDERAVTKGEVLALRLAARAGIRTAEARLVDSEGLPVALIRRFDRVAGGRLMYASAATMIGASADHERAHTYLELVDALRRYGAETQLDIDELWRRIAFSILITNVDDHLHNHGFLHVSRGTWRLAPAFDLNPFPERLRELKTWISEDAGPAATIEGLMSVIDYFRITTPKAKKILGEVERAVARWRGEGRALGMTDRELDAFADAFDHDERKAARAI